MVPGEVYRVRLVTQCQNQAGIVVLHYRIRSVAGLPPDNVESLLAADLSNDIGPLLKNCMTSGASFRGVTIQRIKDTVGIIRSSTASAGAGTRGPGIMPKQISGIITWYTDNASRKGRGRSYIPFPSAADTDGLGAPSTDYLIDLGALSDNLAGLKEYAIGDADIGLSLVVLSATAGDQPVTSYTRRDRFATQRRRGDYGQPNVTGL